MSDHGHFSSYGGHKERRTGKIRWAFQDAQGFGRLDAGSRAGFTSSRPPPPWTSVFQFFISVQCVALRNLDLLIKIGWSVIFPFFC